MADDTFRPQRAEGSAPPPVNITGNVPQEFIQAINQQAEKNHQTPESSLQKPNQNFSSIKDRENANANAPQRHTQVSQNQSGHLKELLEGLKGSTSQYEEILLPSKGKFYDGTNGPSDGIINLRPMTGEEEQILATPRFVRKGQAINMIFQKCIKENFKVENFLTVDRTYMLLYLRGISYSTSYDIEVKCPECSSKFGTNIDLSSLYVNHCPVEYGPILEDVLPNTKLKFHYKLSTGRDEQEINEYRERRMKQFGDSASDDTLTHRTAQLLEDIDGINDKSELQILLKNLPISDVSYIRSVINEPPFGVDTNIEINCPSCTAEFSIDLPLESNFFFPRRKREKNTLA